MTVRVATYNLHGLRDDGAALERVIASARADVFCVQEVPRLPVRRLRWRRLVARQGLRTAGGLGRRGVAVLAGPRAQVLHAESHVLKVFAGLEIRALAVAVVEVGGARLAVGSLHLDLHGAARMRHAAEALELTEAVAARHRAEVVLGGDLNEHPGRPAWRLLAARLADCHAAAPAGDGLTFPAGKPEHRIDALFAARGLRVVSCGGVDAANADLTGASDHLPVLAELRVSS
ncbi:endonuclease/exonuclease/phosphatase family protein [Nonomuraea sp. SBT364]|uniref:endonuclease/exonuclease/phosphatase family protein n=1 Tax=Nonomuraea sp. SBT364 TaxID=1580530 RepID=UPI00066C7B04|nr:endonuclease/exonuclease/phosphatase family protein [Nonomuraea sp. SBT364]